MQEAISGLFEELFGTPPTAIEPVAADGSRRRYWRMRGGPRGSVVGAWGPDPLENRAFVSFTRTFRELGLPVPELLGIDAPRGVWLLEDLGDRTLLRELTEARADQGGTGGAVPGPVLRIYERVLGWLPRFQLEGGRAIDFGVAHPTAEFDARSVRWDLNYFKYHFVRLAGIPFHEGRLEDDFDALVGFLTGEEGRHFLYRDFQSRNIMVRGGEPRFLDYQGGRRGPLAYDVASLLYDGKAALPPEVRRHLLGVYLDALAEDHEFDRGRFEERFPGFVLVRILQAMGAYGYRGLFERRALFLESIPPQARNVEGLLAGGLPLALPELAGVLRGIVDRWAGEPADGEGEGASDPTPPAPEGLTVSITSFSYRRGYPADSSGHGGGFVFDCRSLPNPGRSREFASLTGLDPRVGSWLEDTAELPDFRERVLGLVDEHVRRWLARGFSHLSVSFGCTGGQHRSVYVAEGVARHLREHFPQVGIRLEHRERPHWPEPPWTD